MQPCMSRLSFACLAACLFSASAQANPGLQPYVTLDLGHSPGGQQVSAAASAGIRWPNGVGVALDVTPLDEVRFASWLITGTGVENYHEYSSTFLALGARVDWRFAVDERWSVTPSLGWHKAQAEVLYFCGPFAEYYLESKFRHAGVVVGLSLDRRLTDHWSVGVSARHYPSRDLKTADFTTPIDSVTRYAVGLTWLF